MANERGFIPCRKLGGGAATTRMFPVSASTNEAYFLGDAVIASTTGKVRPLKNGTPLATRPLGVIVGFLNQNQRPPDAQPSVQRPVPCFRRVLMP